MGGARGSLSRERTVLSEYVALRMDVVMDVIEVGDGAGAVRHSKWMCGMSVAGNVAERWADIACGVVHGEWGFRRMAGYLRV